MTDTRFISVEKRTDMNMGLDLLCIGTWRVLSWDLQQTDTVYAESKWALLEPL